MTAADMQVQFFKQLNQIEHKLPWFSTHSLCRGCLLHAFLSVSFYFHLLNRNRFEALPLFNSTSTFIPPSEVKELYVLQCQRCGVCQRSPAAVSRGVLMTAEGRQSLPQLRDMSTEELLLPEPTQHCEGMISWSCWEFISHTNCHRKHFVKISKSK